LPLVGDCCDMRGHISVFCLRDAGRITRTIRRSGRDGLTLAVPPFVRRVYYAGFPICRPSFNLGTRVLSAGDEASLADEQLSQEASDLSRVRRASISKAFRWAALGAGRLESVNVHCWHRWSSCSSALQARQPVVAYLTYMPATNACASHAGQSVEAAAAGRRRSRS